LFPGCYLPLYIFEQRYRDMLEHALKTSRMFCVGTTLDGVLLPVSTAGLIRACKKQEDGTSHVMLYGVSRIRFTDWEQEKPFRIAKIEPILTINNMSDAKLDKLRKRAIELLPPPTPESSESMNMLRASISDMQCGELACDILAYHFIRETESLKQLLAEASIEKRYDILISELERLQALHL